MMILNDPAQIPRETTGGKRLRPDAIPDDAVISIPVWAALEGLAPASVNIYRREGRLPPEDGKLGYSPFWLMGTYRRHQRGGPYPGEPVVTGVLDDPGDLPEDPAAIPGDWVIGVRVWAALQEVKPATVTRNHAVASERRRGGKPRPGDMPPEGGRLGKAPWWYVSAYREWEKRRPGAGAGAGRRPGTRVRLKVARLPIRLTCPHGDRIKIGEGDVRGSVVVTTGRVHTVRLPVRVRCPHDTVITVTEKEIRDGTVVTGDKRLTRAASRVQLFYLD